MSDQELSRAINKLTQLLERMDEGRNSFKFVSNSDRINKPTNDSEEAMDGFVRSVREGRKALEEHKKYSDSFFKGIGRSLPIIEEWRKSAKKNTENLEKSVQGQSKAFKESARAMDHYVKSVGANSKRVKEINVELDRAEKAASNLQSQVKKRTETEKKIQTLTEGNLKGQVKINKDLSNVSTEINKVKSAIWASEKQLQKEAKKGGEADSKRMKELGEKIEKLTEAQRHLESLGEIPKASKELRDTLKNMDLSKVKDPEVRASLERIQKQVAMRNDHQVINELGGIKDTIGGMYRGLQTAVESQTNKLAGLAEKANRTLENLGNTLVAGALDAGRMQMNMIQTRQMRAGGQFNQIIPAMNMGMSEEDLLRVQDENRYLLRRMSRAQTGQAGAAEFIGSGEYGRTIHELGKELGFRGVGATEAMLGIAETLRSVGVDATEQVLKNTTRFIKESHKQFGITQEQMIAAFKDMTREGLLATMATGQDRYASADAMQKEIERRLHLARLLNQDIEIQKKRARELSATLHGDPVEAFKRSIMTGIAGQQSGLSEEAIDLMQGVMLGRGGMTDRQREIGMAALEATRRGSAERYMDAYQSGNVLQGIPDHKIAQMAGIDMQEAVGEAIMASGGTYAETTRTNEPAREMNEFAKSIVRTRELLDGVFQSTVGKLAGGIAGAIVALGSLGLQSIITARSLRILSITAAGKGGLLAGLGGRGGRRMRMPGIGLGAGALMAGGTFAMMSHTSGIADMNRAQNMGEISEAERKNMAATQWGKTIGGLAGSMGGWQGGAALGAKYGPGPWGKAGGAILGGLAGWGLGELAGGMGADALVNTPRNDREWREYAANKAGNPTNVSYGLELDRGRVHRRVMGGIETANLSDADRNRLTELQEQQRRHESWLAVNKEHASENRYKEEEDKLEQVKNRIAGIKGGYFGNHESAQVRSEVFSGFDAWEQRKGNVGHGIRESMTGFLDAINPVSGVAKMMGVPTAGAVAGGMLPESEAAVKALASIDTLHAMSDNNFIDFFQDSTEAKGIIRMADELGTEKAMEVKERTMELLAQIADHTGTSANVDEQMLTKQQALINAGSQQFWRDNIAGVESSINEMVEGINKGAMDAAGQADH